MRVALCTATYCEGMGYLENMLPKYLARAGVETHVVTTDLPPYYWLPDFKQTYGDFSGQHRPNTIKYENGYRLHILAHKKTAGYMRLVGLRNKLMAIRPDIVQCTMAIGWIPLQAAICQYSMGYQLFTANHYHASVFPLACKPTHWWNIDRLTCAITRGIPGRLTSYRTRKCYAISPDCAHVATRFFGVQEAKVEVLPLGVDTELFRPISSEEDRRSRSDLRRRLGFGDADIVCIYTGRFSGEKNPLLLAEAIAQLAARGQPYRGLFVGKGVQGEAIQRCVGCVTFPFVPVQELPAFYRASDLAVWPTQESLSMLDAAACGLPVVANDTITVRERIDGNGLVYRLNDREDLIRVLLQLQEGSVRKRLGSRGSKKMEEQFSWAAAANRRICDYQAALVSASSQGTKLSAVQDHSRAEEAGVRD